MPLGLPKYCAELSHRAMRPTVDLVSFRYTSAVTDCHSVSLAYWCQEYAPDGSLADCRMRAAPLPLGSASRLPSHRSTVDAAVLAFSTPDAGSNENTALASWMLVRVYVTLSEASYSRVIYLLRHDVGVVASMTSFTRRRRQ